MKIIIIGGGLGGMTTALALQREHEVHVYERAASFQPLGTGIGIGSNALEALISLGVGEKVRVGGNRVNKLLFQDAKGKVLNAINFNKITQRYGIENLTVNRGYLQQILYQNLKQATIHFNKQCLSVNQRNSRVYATFQDHGEAEADLLIAADGISSAIRQQLNPDSKPQYAGYTCWRGVTENENWVDDSTSGEIWSPNGRFGYSPLKDNQIYWFACINAEKQEGRYQNWNREQVADLFKNHPRMVKEMISNTSNENLLHHDISDITPISQFAYDRIVLLGDAAHATTPNMGQGAGQAIEDAATLGNLLKRFDLEHALNTYEKARLKHTKKVVKNSRVIGQAAQFESPILIWVRNNIFKMIPSGFLSWRLRFLFEKKDLY